MCRLWNSQLLTFISCQNADPRASESKLHKVIFHPETGMCVVRKSSSDSDPLLLLGSCLEPEAWGYTPEKELTIKGTKPSLHAVGIDEPINLTMGYPETGSRWVAISDSQLHLSTELGNGSKVCLDVNDKSEIVTSSCICLSKDKDCDSQSQWFQIVETTGVSSSKTTNP